MEEATESADEPANPSCSPQAPHKVPAPHSFRRPLFETSRRQRRRSPESAQRRVAPVLQADGVTWRENHRSAMQHVLRSARAGLEETQPS